MRPLLIVLIDGLAADVARECLSVRNTSPRLDPRFRSVRAAWPSNSLCTWSTLFSGREPQEHEVLSIADRFRAGQPEFFRLAATRKTMIVGHYLLFELASQLVFEPTKHTVLASGRPFHGFFYDNTFPLGLFPSEPSATTVFGAAASIAAEVLPEISVVHYDQIDLVGHVHGRGREYRAAALNLDEALSHFLRAAPEASVIITSDHGQDAEGLHGGDSEDERLAPLILSPDLAEQLPQEEVPMEQAELGRFLLDLVRHG